MTEAKIRLYRFLVEMGRITEDEYKQCTGLEYHNLENQNNKYSINWIEEQENPEEIEE